MLFKILVLYALLNLVYSSSEHPILLIVSYDAFKYNFFDTKLVPNMERIRKNGTYSDYLINVFPTKTFPNHHSIATGLYPEVHGVIGNSYFDQDRGTLQRMGKDMFSYNNHVIPIWRLNEDYEKGRYSGSMMWPGAIFPYQGKNITYRQDFDSKMDWYKRIDTVISWLTDPYKPANLVMIYIEEPDTHAHALGPHSQRVLKLLKDLDHITLYLKEQLDKHKLADKANVIHLSDHGLIGVKPANFINITQYMKNGTYNMGDSSPVLQIYPKTGYEQTIYDSLKAGSQKNGHFKVYLKKDFPKQWHYKKSSRSPPILVMSDVGYAMDDLIESAPLYAKAYKFNLTSNSEFGVHGYEPNVTDMRPFFMARGPRIKIGNKVAPFHTVDLFNLFTKILELPHLTNNGSMGNIVEILTEKPASRSFGSVLVVTAVGVLIAVIIVSAAASIALAIVKRRQTIATAAALNKRFPQALVRSDVVEVQHLLEPEDA